MNKTTEALKLAEEALARLIGWLEVRDMMVAGAEREALAAIREALAEPVQEPVAIAWQQGYDQGVSDERTSEASIGIAGFNAKVNPARENPYKTQPVQKPVTFRTDGVCRMRCFVNGVTEYYDEQGNVTMRLDGSEPVKQEPVAWSYEYGTDRGDAVNEIRWYKNISFQKPKDGLFRNVYPLYASSTQGICKHGVDDSCCKECYTEFISNSIDKDLTKRIVEVYLAPVDAKAIRAEALEEAAKVCDDYIDRLHEMRDNDMSLPQYQPELAGRQAGAGRCAAAIRGLK